MQRFWFIFQLSFYLIEAASCLEKSSVQTSSTRDIILRLTRGSIQKMSQSLVQSKTFLKVIFRVPK